MRGLFSGSRLDLIKSGAGGCVIDLRQDAAYGAVMIDVSLPFTAAAPLLNVS